ncbi:vWA domain-containing protein [Salaquimonas pukyongi]|uniref:vWA domain-containing protein n=1 Tax=Salaquimonas pukyongi TaxID=2712698 RepID=UPI0013BE8FB6|nr:TadE/TadG family type IV pilus assembly protein [Salaquimonas pukyongi]
MPNIDLKQARQRHSHIAGNFLASEKGAFAPTFALAAIAVMASAGIAVDYTQLSRAKTLMNQSLDAAVLAAGREAMEGETSKAKLRTVFDNHLQANFTNHPWLGQSVQVEDFSFNKDTGEVNASLKAPIETAFMGLVGKPVVDVGAYSQAKFSNTAVEVSMVLDVTGSMNRDGKLDALKLAAGDAVDILLPKGKSHKNVRLGLVPYSEGVSLSPGLARKASGQSRRTCMTERRRNPHNDVSPRREKVGADDRTEDCPTNVVRPLTNKRGLLLSDIRNMRADGYTAGHLGISWGYYMLSDNWRQFWPNGSKPNGYGSRTQKIAILMTDGEFNTHFQGVKRSSDPRDQKKKSGGAAKALCTDMKRPKKGGDGITIYSIAFKAPKEAKKTLQACATPGDGKSQYYFDASSNQELRAAFRAIAKDIKTLRLSR